MSNRPEQVHNEILQAMTDYGIIGAALLVLMVGTVVVGGVIRAAFGERLVGVSNEDSWRVGGLAGLAGLLTQSNFEFVFHVVPGALLLGLCLGRAAISGGLAKASAGKPKVMTALVTVVGLAVAVWLVPMGWRGARVTAVRLADGFGRQRDVAPEVRLHALTEAIKRWPLQEFFMDRGGVCQQQAIASPRGHEAELLERAMADYVVAAGLNPFDPRPVVNRANLLGALARDAEAEQAFDLAIRLQGGLEGVYRGGYSKAEYLRVKAMRLLEAQQTEAAVQALFEARKALERTCVFPSGAPLGLEARKLRLDIAARLGGLLGVVGRDAEAEEEYEKAAQVWGGGGIRFYHAAHCCTKAQQVWREWRSAQALRLFLKAKWLIDRIEPPLPDGVTREDVASLLQEVGKNIQTLRDGKVEPADPPPQ